MNEILSEKIAVPAKLSKPKHEGQLWGTVINVDRTVEQIAGEMIPAPGNVLPVLHIDPDMQRGVVWSKNQQSRLIDSLLRGIPIGMPLIMWRPDGSREVLDGWNRFSAIDKVLNDDQKLVGCETSYLNGKKFSELPEDWKNEIRRARVTSMELQLKEEIKDQLDLLDIARREAFVYATAGVPATTGEKLKGMRGNVKSAVESIRNSPFFSSKPLKINPHRQAHLSLAAQLLYIETMDVCRKPYYNDLLKFFEDNKTNNTIEKKGEAVLKHLLKLNEVLSKSKQPHFTATSDNLMPIYTFAKKHPELEKTALTKFISWFFEDARLALDADMRTDKARLYLNYKVNKGNAMPKRCLALSEAYEAFKHLE